MQRNFNGALLVLLLVAVTGTPAVARGNDFVIKTGFGNEVTVRNGLFGRKTTTVKDGMGNGYTSKGGLFGSKERSVNLLGNNISHKKGWFGGSEIKGGTMLGDKVSTKKGFFGRRTTTVDASGTASVVKNLWSQHAPKLGSGSAKPSADSGSTAGLTSPVDPNAFGSVSPYLNGSDSKAY